MPAELPTYRRVVTTHDENGNSIIQSDTSHLSEPTIVPGINNKVVWVTEDGLPAKDCTDFKGEGVPEKLTGGLKLVEPNGTNLRFTELGPGVITPMHRTTSLDYNVLVQGELILIVENGAETHLKTPGDVVVQKGTRHAWRNPTNEWVRWATVLIDAVPAVIKSETKETAWSLPAGVEMPV